MRLYAVTGNPILHSLSPAIHNAAYAAAGIDACYSRIAARSFSEALQTARDLGISGLNVTAPFKEDAFEAVDSACAVSKKIRAVNTICIDSDGKTRGYNTDPDGLIGACTGAGHSLKGEKVLVLGAGGAARAAIYGLISQGALVSLSNRTVEHTKQIQADFPVTVIPQESKSLQEAVASHFLIISTVGIDSLKTLDLPLTARHTVLDASYAQDTWLTKAAVIKGASVINGTEWLLHQGAHAFSHFINTEPPLEAMRQALVKREPCSRIVLTGLMGAGKSSVSTELAALLGIPCIELDQKIVESFKMEIPDIFQIHGERKFRKEESSQITTLPQRERYILSTGGGAVLDENNRALLREGSCVVWLWADATTLAGRVTTAERPLLQGTDILQKLNSLYTERMDVYAKSSDLIVSTIGKTPRECAEEIIHECCKAW